MHLKILSGNEKMKLLVVESPSKAKTINQYLGKDYVVISSYGHIRGLPSEEGSVQPDKDFAMRFQILDKSKRNVDEIIKQCYTALQSNSQPQVMLSNQCEYNIIYNRNLRRRFQKNSLFLIVKVIT